MSGLPLVHVDLAALVGDAMDVDDDGVFLAYAERLDQAQRRQAGGAGAAQHDLDILDLLAGDFQGVDQAGGRDDRRAVLVVVEYRDVGHVLQGRLDDEAFRRLDVFEVDAAEGRGDVLDHRDEFLGVLRRDFDVEAVDVGETLEQDRLALHYGLRRQGAEIAETQYRRTVGNDRDHIALGGIVVGGFRIGRDAQHRHSHAR